VISPAISHGIADNKEKMIDALYPIMGGMISKYVTQAIKEMMETINKKIEQGFSIERYKRKVKAKLTGVNESELLLEESSDAHIVAMFVIHKETGLLVSEAHLENSQVGDPHMVASMASAIKDFINDWIANNSESHREVQILSYGNATLYIESAGSVYIIAFLDSEPNYEQRSDINAFFASLLEKYADFFQNFNGDDRAKEVSELSERMYGYLTSQSDLEESTASVKKKRNPAKIIFVTLGVAALVYAGLLFKESYDIHILKKIIIEKTGEEVILVKGGRGYLMEGALDDPSHFQQIVKIVKASRLKEKIEPHLYLSIEGITRSQKRVLSHVEKLHEHAMQQQQTLFAKRLESFKKDMEAKYGTLLKHQEALERELDTMTEKRAALKELLEMKGRISQALAEAMKGEPYYDSKKEVLNFASLHLFEEGNPDPVREKMVEVERVLEKYLKALLPYRTYIKNITVRSFSDSTGDTKSNLALTKRRARKVMQILCTMPFVKKNAMQTLFSSEGKGETSIVITNGVEDRNASRRIEIGTILDKGKLKHDIEQILH
jgi:outer membrane protein OmpA-like peptidoglycan-associated protein